MSDPTESLRVELAKVRTERDKLRAELQSALKTIDVLGRRVREMIAERGGDE